MRRRPRRAPCGRVPASAWPRSSPSIASTSATARSTRSTECPSRSRRGASTPSSGRTGRARARCCKMAAGLVVPDAGEVRIGGERLTPHTAREAIARGVGMVQQHFALVGVLSALENVMLGAEPVGPLGRLDVPRARARADAVARRDGRSPAVGRARGDARRRRPAAARDRAHARPRGARRHPRRADGGAHAGRGGAALRDAAAPGGRRARGRRRDAPPRRGARSRRRGERHAAGEARVDADDEARRTKRCMRAISARHHGRGAAGRARATCARAGRRPRSP